MKTAEIPASHPVRGAGRRPCRAEWLNDAGRRRLLPAALGVALAALVLALAFNGGRGIWEPDEGRYVNIAVQMLRSGDFMVPAFNNEVPHFAKPPLTYWAIAGGISLAGRNEWGARLPNAVAYVATALVVLLLAARLLAGPPWLAALVYLTSLFPFVAANIITTDTLLTLWEAVAMLGFVISRGSDDPRRGLVLMWLAFGVGFLTKGPPALLPLLAIVVFLAARERWRATACLFHPLGLGLFFVVGFGWYMAVAAAHPGLISYFVGHELIGRIATGAHHRNAEWYGAARTYVPVLIAGTLPWTWVLLKQAWRGSRWLLAGVGVRRRLAAADPVVVLLAAWVLVPLAVLFVSKSRLELYVLPLWVPLSLLVARALSAWRPGRAVMVAMAVWVAALLGVKAYAGHHPTHRDSRAIARQIRMLEIGELREIIFVGGDPIWGLALYLPDVQLEPVMLPMVRSPLHPPGPAEVQNLHQELDELAREQEETPMLLLVKPSDVAPVAADLDRRRQPFRLVGAVAGRAALLIESPGPVGSPSESVTERSRR